MRPCLFGFRPSFGLRVSGFGFSRPLTHWKLEKRLLRWRRAADKSGEVGFLLFEVGQVQVHHVAGGVGIEGNVFARSGSTWIQESPLTAQPLRYWRRINWLASASLKVSGRRSN